MIKLSEGLKIAVSTIEAIEVQREAVLIETNKRLYIVVTNKHDEVLAGCLYHNQAHYVTVISIFYADLIQKLRAL